MTGDPLTRHALELLARGHNLYAGDHIDAGLAGSPEQLRRRAERLTRVTAGDGMGAAAAANLRMAAGLQHAAVADTELAAVLADARTEHTLGRHGTRRLLDDAHSDSMPAADTPLGRQEALRRMAARLRQQRQYLHRSHRYSQLLAQRLRRVAYLRRRHSRQVRHGSPAAGVPLGAVRYEKSFTSGHVRQRIGAALDHMGVSDPAARRNWLRGYETLIARESGGRPCVIAPEPATVPAGATQPDGHRMAFARGIAQTIPATFARYHQPGTSTNIYDPVANICASMNYVIHRYGVSLNGENLAALVQQADAHRPPKGY
ncbi:MAG: transglycosylase SLT domain-containing protein [Mycobacterium sp.]